ncbi:MAG: hypothetical protein AAF281_08220 [Pseudomonadota bacterium]
MDPPFWVMAERQSAGRGRRGRAWLGGDGNFFATYLMRVDAGPDRAALRSFVAALALLDALDAVADLGPRMPAPDWSAPARVRLHAFSDDDLH